MSPSSLVWGSPTWGWVALALSACAGPPLPAEGGLQNAALVACIWVNTYGRVYDPYVIRSSGDPVAVKRMFDRMVWEGVPRTVVGWPSEWEVIELRQKDGPELPKPDSCGPKPKSN